jgi:hypothetical protein
MTFQLKQDAAEKEIEKENFQRIDLPVNAGGVNGAQY